MYVIVVCHTLYTNVCRIETHGEKAARTHIETPKLLFCKECPNWEKRENSSNWNEMRHEKNLILWLQRNFTKHFDEFEVLNWRLMEVHCKHQREIQFVCVSSWNRLRLIRMKIRNWRKWKKRWENYGKNRCACNHMTSSTGK